jgi:hypothetical protein
VWLFLICSLNIEGKLLIANVRPSFYQQSMKVLIAFIRSKIELLHIEEVETQLAQEI